MNITDKIADLDQAAMSPILAANGEQFDLATRKCNIEKSMMRGDHCVSHFKGDELLGYALVWKKSDTEFVITSLQIHPVCTGLRRGLVLRRLIFDLLPIISENRHGEVIAEAHPKNSDSISLCQKLGFRNRVNPRKNRIELRQSISNLVTLLPPSRKHD